MKPLDTNDPLDGLLHNAAPEPMDAPDFSTWAQCHADDLEQLKTQSQSSVRYNRFLMPLGRIAGVAATILLGLGLGFLGGRLSLPPAPDISQLRAELEASQQTGYRRLREDLLVQVHNDLAALTPQILAASKQITDEQMIQLIQLIDEARLRDRQRVAKALAQVQMRTMAQLEQDLQYLAVPADQQN